MSEEQLGRLATFLKNRVRSALPRDPELTLVVHRAIDAGLEDFFVKERLEAYESVDVERVVEEFDERLGFLKDLVKELQEVLPGNVKLTISTSVKKPVTIGAYHRVTLSEFPVGTVLRRRHITRGDGSVGGVELVVMR